MTKIVAIAALILVGLLVLAVFGFAAAAIFTSPWWWMGVAMSVAMLVVVLDFALAGAWIWALKTLDA